MVRFAPLRRAPARGRLIIPHDIVDETTAVLRAAHGPEGRHEGLVLWAGRRCGDDRVVAAAFVPETSDGPTHVFVDEAAVGRASRAMRRFGLVLVAQVHSHPGRDTRHSDGDDHLIVFAHEGMWSLVGGRHGDAGLVPGVELGVHQYQDGRWVAIQDAAETVLIVPTMTEVRLAPL